MTRCADSDDADVNERKMTEDEITRLVFVRDEPVPADLAVVFGSANETELRRRISWGCELYHTGHTPAILVSGGGAGGPARTEARSMVNIARDLGVAASALLIEDRSSNTFENARFSRPVLEAAGLLDTLSRVILISSAWHMRRVLLTTCAYFPRAIQYICCPPPGGCHRENWMNSRRCRRIVENETLLLETFIEMNVLPDP